MRRLLLGLILVVAGLGAARAAEGDLTVVGGVDFGFKTLRLDIARARSSFSPSYVTINPTLGLGYNSFYASASYDKSLGIGPGDDEVEGGAGPTASTLDFSRVDTTYTLGYRLNPSFSVFVGHTRGVSQFTDTTFDATLIVTRTNYSETGPFAGVAYTKAFGDKGSLGLSVGYAKLDGELEVLVRPGAATFTAEGDVTGLSYGVTWSGSLTGSLGYRVGVKATRYKMEEPLHIIERYTNIYVGIVNYF